MDNLAHALVGAALGRAVADRHVARAGLIGVVAANAPDGTELFLGLPGWTRAEYLTLHRGVTHSLAGALIEIVALTLLIGGGMHWWRQRRGNLIAVSWSWLALCIATAVLSHLFMDWQGSYGLRPFLPWKEMWYYGDWVAIVDPFFWLVPLIVIAWGANRHWRPLTGTLLLGGAITLLIIRNAELVADWVLAVDAVLCIVALVGWIRFWFGPVARQRAAALGLLLLAGYAGAQGVAVQARKRDIREAAERRFGPGAQWAALTNVGWPFTWEPVYASRDTVASDDWRTPRHLDEEIVQRAIRETPEGRAMATFARFLAAEVGSGVVYLRDARYARAVRDNWAVVRVRME